MKTSQKTAVGTTIYANSITLTPGTITVEVNRHDNELLVHALTKAGADGLAARRDGPPRHGHGGQALMLAAAMLAVLAATALMVVRALSGPTVFDRLVAANAIGNAAILILALYGFLTGRPEFLDIGHHLRACSTSSAPSPC